MVNPRKSAAALTLMATMFVFSGCASFRGILPNESTTVEPDVESAPDPEVALRVALRALDEGKVSFARRRLARIAADCEAPDPAIQQRAALLLASIALDPGNPDGTPDEVALIAARVLHDAAPGDSDAALARSLYLVALDRGAAPVTHYAPAEGPEGCPPASGRFRAVPLELPQPIEPTSAARLTALQDTLSARTDSLRTLREELSASRQRTETLEAEIERIRLLLRGGLEDPDTIRRYR
ncbi:MAG: hypothetical protein LC667_16355 [Thioalkalivibrio sp.]|nr:hypothetical protein [Thioalkalivibrio sp.]